DPHIAQRQATNVVKAELLAIIEGARYQSAGLKTCADIAVRRGAQRGVILEVALDAVVVDSRAAADDQFIALKHVPGKAESRPQLEGGRIKHAFLYLSTGRREHAVRMERIAVDVITGAALISARAEYGVDPLALKVDAHVRYAQTRLQSEVRAHLPRILSVELVVVEAIVTDRRLCAMLHIGELSGQQIAPIAAGAIPVPVVE